MASVCALPERTLLRQFQKFVGLAPLAYLHRLRLNAVRSEPTPLIDVAADRHIWGDSFDGSVNDPIELQDRIVEAAICGVVSHITDAEIERTYDKDPNALAVRDLTEQALPIILSANVPSARKAISIFTRALELDPGNARPMALLACSQAQLGSYNAVARASMPLT